MSRAPHPMRLVPSNGIIRALRDGLPLSTDMLAVKAGLAVGMVESEYLTPEWRGRVYRNASRLCREGTLASVKSYTGKTYERVWRLNQ